MTPLLLFFGISVAGGLGAVTRLLLDGIIRGRTPATVPWGTITINITGSLLLGLVVGMTATGLLPDPVEKVVGVGFLGGYTTFSTASFETVRLLQERRWSVGVLNGFGVLVAATAAVGLGLWIGSRL